MYQGMCGGACNGGAPVLPKPESQLSSGMRTNLLGDAIVYQHQVTTDKKQFASATDYMRYKKARILSGTPLCVAGRPPQSAIITRLIETGCQACQPVCPVGTTEENAPVLVFAAQLSDPSGMEELQIGLNNIYGYPVTIPDPPAGYPEDGVIWVVGYPNYCNSTSQTLTIYDNGGSIISSQVTDLGEAPDPLFYNGIILFYSELFDPLTSSVTLTASNSCSSSTGPVLIGGGPGGRSAKIPTHMSTLMEKFAAIKK